MNRTQLSGFKCYGYISSSVKGRVNTLLTHLPSLLNGFQCILHSPRLYKFMSHQTEITTSRTGDTREGGSPVTTSFIYIKN